MVVVTNPWLAFGATLVTEQGSSVAPEAGLLRRWNRGESRKGTGFVQPLRDHDHWHVDASYLNICGTFYFFRGLLDGYGRYLVHWEIREAMKKANVEIVIQRAREKFPQARPRIVSDNGPQFIAKNFNEFVRLSGMTHVRTPPYYPQSNGKIERFHQSLKNKCIRPRTPLSLADARYTVTDFVDRYNTIRLHAAIGYIAPKDQLEGRAEAIRQERKRKLAEACERRKRMADQKTVGTEESVELMGGISVGKMFMLRLKGAGERMD